MPKTLVLPAKKMVRAGRVKLADTAFYKPKNTKFILMHVLTNGLVKNRVGRAKPAGIALFKYKNIKFILMHVPAKVCIKNGAERGGHTRG